MFEVVKSSNYHLNWARNSGVVAGGGGQGATPPSDNFLGALKFVIPM